MPKSISRKIWMVDKFLDCVQNAFSNGSQCTVWKLRKFSLTLFSQKFRESDGFTKEITKYIVDLTKEIFREENFSFSE